MAAARVAMFQGLIKPVRVASGSMAESLLGPHFEVTCGDCGFAFACDADHPPAGGMAVCPNCGYRRSGVAQDEVVPGQRVLIDRSAAFLRRPRRWQVFAFRSPDDADSLSVKRIVGLPGEHVEIRQGDIYIDGRIARKSLDELRPMAIEVHDSARVPTRGESLPRRWQADSSETAWRTTQRGFVFHADGDESGGGDVAHGEGEFDWLTYHHWRTFALPAYRTEESPIVDSYAFNQSASSPPVAVGDLYLTCRLEMAPGSCMAIRGHDGRSTFVVELACDEYRVRLVRDESVLREAALGTNPCDRPVTIEFALCDRQVLLAIDGRSVLAERYDAVDRPFSPTARPLALGVAEGTVRIERLQVLRDVYYLDPSGLDYGWSPDPLADNEWLVMGDNPAVSRDSRQWSRAGLPRNLLVGKVLPFRLAGER